MARQRRSASCYHSCALCGERASSEPSLCRSTARRVRCQELAEQMCPSGRPSGQTTLLQSEISRATYGRVG
eukprot:11226514-Lingulodinium_polyedra.AAC.1